VSNRESAEQNRVDDLTGGRNRKYFASRYGHPIGDNCIKQVAARLGQPLCRRGYIDSEMSPEALQGLSI
jgi:PleD family two-component response regulator